MVTETKPSWHDSKFFTVCAGLCVSVAVGFIVILCLYILKDDTWAYERNPQGECLQFYHREYVGRVDNLYCEEGE